MANNLLQKMQLLHAAIECKLELAPHKSMALFANNLVTGEYYARWGFDYRNYYEFGTGEGYSLAQYLKGLQAACRIKHLDITKFNVFLFDTFEGLPEQTSEDNNPGWHQGEFAGSVEDIKKVIDKTIGKKRPTIQFISGDYKDTLSKAKYSAFKQFPPSIVNVDVDYYSSAKTVLDWLAPMLQNGTILYFDDLFEYFGNPWQGERRAISEFNQEHTKEKAGIYPFEICFKNLTPKTRTFAYSNANIQNATKI